MKICCDEELLADLRLAAKNNVQEAIDFLAYLDIDNPILNGSYIIRTASHLNYPDSDTDEPLIGISNAFGTYSNDSGDVYSLSDFLDRYVYADNYPYKVHKKYKGKPKVNELKWYIALGGKVEVKHEKGYEAFLHAFDRNNYSPKAWFTSLSKVPNYKEDTNQLIANLYGHHTDAELLVAYVDDYIVGRAIVWPKITVYDSDPYLLRTTVSFIERPGVVYTPVGELIFDKAKAMGIETRPYRGVHDKKIALFDENSYKDETQKELLIDRTENDAYVELKEPCKEKGLVCPGSIFKFLQFEEGYSGDLDFSLRSKQDEIVVGPRIEYEYKVCPICGGYYTLSDIKYGKGLNIDLCAFCQPLYITRTKFGPVFFGEMTEFEGQLVPADCFCNDVPTQAFRNYRDWKAMEELINNNEG